MPERRNRGGRSSEHCPLCPIQGSVEVASIEFDATPCLVVKIARRGILGRAVTSRRMDELDLLKACRAAQRPKMNCHRRLLPPL
jgi:hypothetical protein